MDHKSLISDWSHAPVHKLLERGTYMITAGTYKKEPMFNTPEKLDLMMTEFFRLATEFEWLPQAWAFMSNHYHVILLSPEQVSSLPELIREVHRVTGMRMNVEDQTPGRQVWYQYWDSRISYQKSYYPRLKYVHNNPVHHGLVPVAENYDWCSAGWFKMNSEPSFRKTIESFKTDFLKVIDDF